MLWGGIMSYKPMFNFGSVRFGGVGGGDDISFDLGEGSGNIRFTEEIRSTFKADDGTIHRKTEGFRIDITISFSNLDSETADKLSTLYGYLNLLHGYNNGSDSPIDVYPRFNDDLDVDDNYSYPCFLNSSIEMLDLGRVNVGQSGDIAFTSQKLHPMLTSSYPAFSNWKVYNGGVIEDLQFNNDGTLETAKFKIN